MSAVIGLDICIRQGAQYLAEYQRVEARYLFEALSSATSGVSAPEFPSEIDATVTDNGIVWINRGRWNPDLHPNADTWLASTAYGRRAKVVTPIVPVDLAGYTGNFQLRATVDAEDAIHTGTVTFGTRANGEFKMQISTADTREFTFDSCKYDLELINPASEVDFVLYGTVLLIKEVTRVEG